MSPPAKCRGHEFYPWSKKLPLAAGQLRPRTTTTEPTCPRAQAPQQEKPPQREACALQERAVLARHNERKPTCSTDPEQPEKKERVTVITLVNILRHTSHLVLSLLPGRKRSLREVGPLTQSHTAWRWQRGDMSAGHPVAPEPGRG